MKHQTETTALNFSDQAIYVGLDVHHRSWKVAIYTERYEHKVFSQDPSVAQLVRYLHQHFPGAKYYSVYEAGFCGFHIHDELVAAGIDNLVVNPADIPESNKDRKRKTDSRDARKLARELRAGNLTGIYCPSRERHELRGLVRHRQRLVGNQTRCKNRIKAVLKQYGMEVPAHCDDRHWSGAFIKWLEELEFSTSEGKMTMHYLLTELKSHRQLISEVNRSLRKLAQKSPHAAVINSISSIPGIGQTSAWIIYGELMDIERFKSLDHLYGYCGLVPDTNSSGERQRIGDITRRSNRWIRSVLIECAWVAIRKDPILQQAFGRYAKNRQANKAIIRIAKKLLSRIRCLWRTGATYQINYSPAQQLSVTAEG